MILINFAHPLTPEQIGQITVQLGRAPMRIVAAPSQFDVQQPLGPQIAALVAGLPLSVEEWANEPVLVNPPGLSFAAVLLAVELHGRLGYFAPCLRLRPVLGAVPPRFEVAEVLDLQEQREAARRARH
ncbi:MAG: CRISPR-associated protein Csx15 [Chloroflexi bacterium]|nr:CRISPR-associated protein Csx15 [Chloroflexota bacterium]